MHVLYYSFVNPRRCTPEDYIDFLVASPGPVSCTEAARVPPDSPFAPAHDSYNRRLNRLEPAPAELWGAAEPQVERGINLITLLWTDGDRKVPVDYRLFSTTDGKTKHDHFWEMLLMAKGRGFSPKYVLFDTWYASLENLKQVRGFGWHWLTRLRGDRVVSPDDRRQRRLDEVAACASGTVLHLRGYGLIKVFRIVTPDGDMEHWATNDLGMGEGARRHYAEMSFAIENYHRELKQYCGVEKCRVRASRAQRNHIGLSLRAFLRLEWHFFTTGVSAFEAKLRLVRDAVRSYLARPFIILPKPSTA